VSDFVPKDIEESVIFPECASDVQNLYQSTTGGDFCLSKNFFQQAEDRRNGGRIVANSVLAIVYGRG
jgi:hypothetical protein